MCNVQEMGIGVEPIHKRYLWLVCKFERMTISNFIYTKSKKFTVWFVRLDTGGSNGSYIGYRKGKSPPSASRKNRYKVPLVGRRWVTKNLKVIQAVSCRLWMQVMMWQWRIRREKGHRQCLHPEDPVMADEGIGKETSPWMSRSWSPNNENSVNGADMELSSS